MVVLHLPGVQKQNERQLNEYSLMKFMFDMRHRKV